MINCILIQNNEIIEVKVKNLTEDTIYKKCNFKNMTDFSKIRSWDYKNNFIELWGKNKGFSNSLSNFELFKNNGLNIYGKSIFLIRSNEGKYLSLTKDNFINYFNLNLIDEVEKVIDEKDKNILKEEEIEEKIVLKKEKEKEENDKDSEYSYNSELTYELYEYSDDE